MSSLDLLHKWVSIVQGSLVIFGGAMGLMLLYQYSVNPVGTFITNFTNAKRNVLTITGLAGISDNVKFGRNYTETCSKYVE